MLYFSGIILYIHITVLVFYTDIPQITCTQRHCTPTPHTCFNPPIFIYTCLVLIAVVVSVTHAVSTYLMKWLTYLICAPPNPSCIYWPLLMLVQHGLCIVGGCVLSKWGLGVGIMGVVCWSSWCPLSAEWQGHGRFLLVLWYEVGLLMCLSPGSHLPTLHNLIHHHILSFSVSVHTTLSTVSMESYSSVHALIQAPPTLRCIRWAPLMHLPAFALSFVYEPVVKA